MPLTLIKKVKRQSLEHTVEVDPYFSHIINSGTLLEFIISIIQFTLFVQGEVWKVKDLYSLEFIISIL